MRTVQLHPEVAAALRDGRAVVALESSVLAQGLPEPSNREADRRMRAAIRERGAVPAVTAVVRGVPAAGLDDADLERFLARSGIPKVSARDLPWAMARGSDGATTVAASLVICAQAGLRCSPPAASAACTARVGRAARRIGRPARALAVERRHGVRGREIHSRPSRDGRASRDARRNGHRIPHRRVSGLFHGAHRAGRWRRRRYAGEIAAAFRGEPRARPPGRAARRAAAAGRCGARSRARSNEAVATALAAAAAARNLGRAPSRRSCSRRSSARRAAARSRPISPCSKPTPPWPLKLPWR